MIAWFRRMFWRSDYRQALADYWAAQSRNQERKALVRLKWFGIDG